MIKKPQKVLQLIEKVSGCIVRGDLLDSYHANLRRGERAVLRREMTYVLKHGYHEKAKDKFDEHHKAWNYSIRGKTLDGKDLRVIVSFENESMLVVTVIEVGK